MLMDREPCRELPGRAARQALLAAMRRLDRDPIGDCAIEALLRAGEIECALADRGARSAREAAAITDAFAAHVLVDNGPSLRGLERNLKGLELPDHLQLSTPAGYAHYGLDPRQYAALAESLDARMLERPIAVIGVRSIGTSLGAIVRETLRLRGALVERISVKAVGDFWQREVRFDREDAAFVEAMRERGASFLIVHEGPHANGAEFLAVAEALVRAGVRRDAIVLCTSRPLDPDGLLARDTIERWSSYRAVVAPPWTPVTQAEDLSHGAWRKLVYGEDAAAWPACWPQLERIKRRTGGIWFDKFDGFAPYSEAPFERASALAQAGYAPPPRWLGHGFVRYPWLPGRPARVSDLDAPALCEMARYCAFRTRAFRCGGADTKPLERMLRTNVEATFGLDLGERVRFEIEVPIVPDARMQPFEWCVLSRGKWCKTDGHSHGDGAFLPGPTDVCWDLAGVIVEWNLDAAQRERFLQDYAQLTGDEPHRRVGPYLLAYCAQRLGETYIAANTVGAQERARLFVALEGYRNCLAQCLGVERPSVVRRRLPTRAYSSRAA